MTINDQMIGQISSNVEAQQLIARHTEIRAESVTKPDGLKKAMETMASEGFVLHDPIVVGTNVWIIGEKVSVEALTAEYEATLAELIDATKEAQQQKAEGEAIGTSEPSIQSNPGQA